MDPILPEPSRDTGNASPAQAGQVSSDAPVPQNMPSNPSQPVSDPATPVTTPVQASPATPSPNQPSGDSPLIADDVDVIEKEWVDKAKKIVSATKADPHTQDKEISKLQADYLMKRYNKKLKVNE